MGLTRVAIARPIFILMVILAMVILGAVSFTRLNAELYPSLSIPIVTVVTTYPGAGPEDVEQLVTRPIEDAVAGVANVDVVSSSSSEGVSQVTVTFTDTADLNVSASDVERIVSSMRGRLPDDADSPSVLKFDPTQLPVLSLALSGDMPPDALFRLADETIKPRLTSQEGVASVSISGGLQRELKVQVDPVRLRAYGLTIDQVSQALSRENQGVPGGTIEEGRQQTNLRFYGLFQSPAELEALTITSSNAGPIRLREVAMVVDTHRRVTSRTYLDGNEAVALTVTKQSSANEIRTVDAVRAEVEQLNRALPGNARLSVVRDTSRFTRNSLDGVTRALVEAVVLTGLVLLVFLHSLRSTFIVLLAIPTSLISTFIIMGFLGFTRNIMTSMALVLVIGVLVDDSIVVLENIFRHLEQGDTPRSAALKGRSEIGLAAIAITLVDVVVFTPVAFMSGTVGSFFREFGLVVVTATLLSLFISFTLTPMLASRWLDSGSVHIGGGPWGWSPRRFERLFEALRALYTRTLGWVLHHRWLPPALGVLSLVLAFAMVPAGLVKFEFIPESDNGSFSVTVELPPGSSLAATEQALREIEARLASTPEVDFYLTTSGVGAGGSSSGVTGQNARFGTVQATLVDRGHRERSVKEISDQFTRDAADIAGASIRVSTSGGDGAQPVQVLVTGDDPQTLTALATRVEGIVAGIPNTRDVTNSASRGSSETRLVPNRLLLAELGIGAQQVALALRTAVEGTVATQLRPAGEKEVDVRLIASDAARANLNSLGVLPLTVMRADGPVTVRLDQVTSSERVAAPTSIDRRNRQRVITVGASLAGNTLLGDVSQPLQAALTRMQAAGEVPTGYAVRLGGQAEDQGAAFGQLLLALGLAVLLEYMLLAALYESMVLPFATMFALPLAIVGALLGLAISGNTLNLLSLIGVVVLMGLVGKNGILLVDYTNALRRDEGIPRHEALVRAGSVRLRPIVMTTTALVFAMLPLALQLEEGSEIYAGMANVIIGGMLSSTLLSLLVIPCMYTYFDDLQSLITRAWSWRPFTAPRPATSVGDVLPTGGGPSTDF